MRSVKEALQAGCTNTKGPQVPDGILTIQPSQVNERPTEAEAPCFLDDGCATPQQDVGLLYRRLTWSIPKFSEITKRELRSEIFEIGSCKWYILVYPQGCDICNHLSLFLCVADYDELLPGWSHFAQFTIAVINKDPKKTKYSDTLHRFCKKEHDWGWKKFMELSKVLDGFTHADTLVIKAQVQVVIDKPGRPFRCLHPGYKRELVRVYLSNVEGVLRRFFDERRTRLGWLKREAQAVGAFWRGLLHHQQQALLTERTEVILKGLVKQFLNEKEVTSTLVMDALYSGCREVEAGTRSWVQIGSHGVAPHVLLRSDPGVFEVTGDVQRLIGYVDQEVVLTRGDAGKASDAGSESTSGAAGGRGTGGGGGDDGDTRRECVELDEVHLAELGKRTAVMYIISHVCTEKLEVAYREAEALARQDQLIAEELMEQSSDMKRKEQAERDKERRAKKKERVKQRKEEERARKTRDELGVKQGTESKGQQEEEVEVVAQGMSSVHQGSGAGGGGAAGCVPTRLAPPLSAQQSRYAVLDAHDGPVLSQGEGLVVVQQPVELQQPASGDLVYGTQASRTSSRQDAGPPPHSHSHSQQGVTPFKTRNGGSGPADQLFLPAGKHQPPPEQTLASCGSDCSSLTGDVSSSCVEELQAQLLVMKQLVDSLQAELLEKDRHLEAFRGQVAHLQQQLHQHSTWTAATPGLSGGPAANGGYLSRSFTPTASREPSLQAEPAPPVAGLNTNSFASTTTSQRAWTQAASTTTQPSPAAGLGGNGIKPPASAFQSAGLAGGADAGPVSGSRRGVLGSSSQEAQQLPGAKHTAQAGSHGNLAGLAGEGMPRVAVTPSYRNAAAGVLVGSGLQPAPAPAPAATTGVSVPAKTAAVPGAAGAGAVRVAGGDAAGAGSTSSKQIGDDQPLVSRTSASSCSSSSCGTTPNTFPADLDTSLPPARLPAPKHSLSHVMGFPCSLGEGLSSTHMSGLSAVRSANALGAAGGLEADDLGPGLDPQTAVQVQVQVDSPGLDDFAHMGLINDLLGPDE